MDDTTPRQKQISKITTLQVEFIAQKTYQNTNQLALIVISLCLATFYFGFCLAFLSNVQTTTMVQYFGQSAGNPSILGGLIGGLPIGAALGALAAPLFMKILSRKQFLLFFDCLAIIIAGVIQINNIIVLFVCRLLQGFIIGNFMAITPIYINQLVPVPIQGSFGALTQLFVVIGVVICYLLGVIFNLTNVNGEVVWRFLFSFTGVTAIVQIILLLVGFIPQSPISLIQRGKIQQAKAIYAKFNIFQTLDKILEQSMTKVNKQSGPPQLNETQQYGSPNNLRNVKYNRQMPLIFKAVFLGFELPFMQQLCGINMIVTQIGTIVQKYDKSLALYAPLLANIIQLIATAFSVLMLTYFGRRTLMLAGNLSLAIFDLIIGVMFLILYLNNWTPAVYIALVFIMLFMISYGLTIGPVVWLYVPEIIPAKIVPPATFMNWLGCSICVIVTPIVINAADSSYPVFLFFGVITLVFFIINYFWVIQTKGLTLMQISKKISS